MNLNHQNLNKNLLNDDCLDTSLLVITQRIVNRQPKKLNFYRI